MNINELSDSFNALLGQFTPSNLGSRLFMERADLNTLENFLVWFHERFHYLQVIFTPYGHLKWAAYRTYASDVVNCWLNLSNILKLQKMIPINEYLLEDNPDCTKLAYNIWIYDLKNDLYKIVEQGATTYGNMHLFNNLDYSSCCPIINYDGQEYRLRGIDILESFAKFEEAMLGELTTGKKLDETINPNNLKPEYYVALYYFIETLGVERLMEFPVVCELSLATPHIPSPLSLEEFYNNAPNWRFVNILKKIKEIKDLPIIDFNDDNSFYEYSNVVLQACGFDTFDTVWSAAEEYANMSDLSMAKEMKTAIECKKNHPWMLSYPMGNVEEFFDCEFNRFAPYFTIMEDGVIFNCENIKLEELIFENHLQALAQQICGYNSKYCQDSFKLMCGYTYFGINTCPHLLSGECTGYIDHTTLFPEVVLDDKQNIKSGCTFDICMKGNGIELSDIKIGIMKLIAYENLMDMAKKHTKS